MRPFTPCALLSAMLAVHGVAQAASAQLLADVARREEERRKHVTSGRLLTNDDLAPSGAAPAPPPAEAAPSTAGAPSPPPTAPPPRVHETEGPGAPDAPTLEAGTVIEGRPKRDEQYWRERARDLRGRLERANTEVAATQSRLAELDATPGTPPAAQQREIVAAALVRLQAGVRSLSEELERLLRRARIEGVPPDWIR